MYQLPKHKSGRPPLFLAPMEGVGASPFRKAIATIGGFDESCTEFMRVPLNAHVASLAKKYSPNDTFPIPQAAQIMGSDPELMAAMAIELEKRGAHRIDLNCGCPSNRVTGRGAGSTLLKTPSLLNEIAKAMVGAVKIPVSIKMRAGFDDTSLFKENLLAAEESGCVFITLHPRTKVEGYSLPGHWERLAQAKQILSIPLIGSGEVTNPQTCKQMRAETGVDGVMIGRGAVANPWIFQDIKRFYGENAVHYSQEGLQRYFSTFLDSLEEGTQESSKVNQIKQLLNYILRAHENTEDDRRSLLHFSWESAHDLVDKALPLIHPLFLL